MKSSASYGRNGIPNSLICVDASFIIRLLESADPDSVVVQLWVEWHEEERPVVAPTLLYYEIANALHRYTVHGKLLPREADDSWTWP